MQHILLYVTPENPYILPMLWMLGLLTLAAMTVLIFVQRRSGFQLKSELTELEKVQQESIEQEFILRAMKLATWHIDPKTHTMTYEADYREGQDNYIPPPNVTMEEFAEKISKADASRVYNAMLDLCEGRKETYNQQYRLQSTTSGKSYWVESFATIAERDNEGNPSKIVGTSMRIDDRKDLETALISARNKAEESDRLKTAFLANMGHEIRTPLNAIVGFADLLPMVEDEEERAQLITEIQNNNHKLLGIIDGLVSMSKVEAAAESLVKSQIEVNGLLQAVADAHAATVDPTAVSVITKFPYSEMMITTDADKLTEIVSNLMDNSVKFTAKGTITLGYDLEKGDRIRIWVRDTGKGIAEEDLHRIFERFVKVDEYIPGTGLGLSVAKSHAESLSGFISVESKLGEGSTFSVELPLG